MIVLLLASLLVFGTTSPASSKSDPIPDSLYKQASRYLDQGDYQKAIINLKSLEQNRAWSEEAVNLRKTYNNLGFAYYKLDQFDSSVFYYKKSYDYSVLLKDTAKIVSAFNSVALNYRKLGQYGLSLENYQKAHDLALRQGNLDILAQILTNLGLVYQNLGRKEEALAYHHKSWAVATEAKDSTAAAVALNNIAISHKALEALDSSLYYNLKSLELKRRMGNKPNTVVSTLNNIGTSYLAKGNYPEAEKYFIESNGLYKQIKDIPGLLASYNNLGDLALRRNQLENSQAYLDSGAFLFPKVSDLVFKRDNLELRLAVLERKKDYERALPVYRDLTAINERIFQEEKLNVQEVEASYRIREESLLREAAEQQAGLAEADAKAARQFLVLFGVIVLLSLIFGMQLFRLNKQLKTKNAIIQDQKRDNEHRIYNFLSRLQGLLRTASENVPDQTSREILLNSEAAIISAAALQEQLTYSETENEEILVGKYLEGLTHRLREMFELTGSTAKLQIFVKEDAKLPVQTALNLGLMISEIITNSMKYAFPSNIPDPIVGISVRKSENILTIQVGDNGVGIADLQKKGMGSVLIQRLAKYIKAELSVDSGAGTQYLIALKVAEHP
ncbi:tetratricopeptide repeat protein [Algoriphagus aestuariicola]|uniref:Tetratricopeptide repeat protein n=1 Tax=Algoriphagus aestuariicola TaxID=1852016 RepID=A0ABS3BU11_9BACT|nr:tetratricopeptide repeat protein [Algoriphagus aestuariicola]MBN7801179.1 tetratricopeptide repeat protein [Algoriphagus aestuariicola]